MLIGANRKNNVLKKGGINTPMNLFGNGKPPADAAAQPPAEPDNRLRIGDVHIGAIEQGADGGVQVTLADKRIHHPGLLAVIESRLHDAGYKVQCGLASPNGSDQTPAFTEKPSVISIRTHADNTQPVTPDTIRAACEKMAAEIPDYPALLAAYGKLRQTRIDARADQLRSTGNRWNSGNTPGLP